MMNRLVTISGCVLALACGGSAASAQSADVRAAVQAGNKQFVAAFGKQDAAAIAALYTADAEAYPPNSDVVRGRPALEKLWQGVFASGITNATLATRQVESAGDLAVESGTYEMKTKDGATADRGKYVVVWKRVGGQWMLHRDIWNTSQPAK